MKKTILPFLFVFLFASALVQAGELKILAPPEGQPKAYAVAAAELQKYWAAVTGQTLEITRESNDSDSYLIIGSDAVNPFVRQLVERKAIPDFVLRTASDDYRILTVQDGERTHLILAGGRGRSTLYAVYAFLEDRAGCHWFWDGDVVPKRESIDISGLDVRESPRFQYRGQRYFAHRSLHRFQAEHWSFEDWKQEIDWLVKKRLNVFMLRIGMDDVFQKAFPEIVDYPDPAKPLPEAMGGYDNRSLFWSLQFRGQLRKSILVYAFDRDLMHPEDFGTMSHWYSRTPQQFLDRVKPTFVPQSSGGYGQPTGLVWDIRKDENLENYWKLTQAHVDNYGKPELFHTIGIAERNCYKDRAENLKMKLYAYRRLIDNLRTHYPNAPLLLAGWDFYSTWTAKEVQEFIGQLDPEKTILWDYEADAAYDVFGNVGSNFTQWGVIGKFPYTFGIFQAYENGQDIRTNYSVIEQRQKLIVDDPYCRGYILWPENSHADIFVLHYFTSNAWRPGVKTTEELLSEFCAQRYGSQAEALNAIWLDVLPISQMLGWGGNFWSQAHRMLNGTTKLSTPEIWRSNASSQRPRLEKAPEIFDRLAALEWNDPFIRRDSIDLARTTCDRLLTLARVSLMAAMHDWREGKIPAEEVQKRVDAYAELLGSMHDMLALHSDYSMYETLEGMNRVEKIQNPDFDRVLIDNASCGYCESHQYELMAHWYEPSLKVFLDWGSDRLDRGDISEFTTPPEFPKTVNGLRGKLLDSKLVDLRPTLERTPENYRAAMERAAKAARVVISERP